MDHNNVTITSSTVVISVRQTSNGYVLNGKIMVGSVIVLFAVVIVLICFNSYGRWLYQRQHRRRRAHQLFFLSTTNTNNDGRVPRKGLDLSVLKTIPTFVYSSTIHDKQLECAVCLSEFEDSQKGRILPKCKHAFHVDCIDMWFHSHFNCPICRTVVQPDIQVHPPADVVSLSVNEPPSACSVIEKDERQMGCSSSSLPPLELKSILVEVPRGDIRGLDDMGLELSKGSGLKAPGKRVMALKRIWSI